MSMKPSGVASVVAFLPFVVLACSRQPGADSGTARADSTPATPAAVAPATPPDSSSGAPLRGTEWRLVALGTAPVTPSDTLRAARLTLHPDSKQVTGSGGCNRMFGVYELKGDALRFSGVGSTKMACKSGMDTEGAFLPALLRVARWHVSGQQLELSDSSGVVLARFEARPR